MVPPPKVEDIKFVLVLHLRSESVAVRRRVNMVFDNDEQMISRPKFPDICSTVEENPGKTSTRKLTRPGIEPGPAGREATLITDHSGGEEEE